jgi:signal transduction histidine kinase
MLLVITLILVLTMITGVVGATIYYTINENYKINQILSKMNSNQDSKINGISQEISKVNQEVSQKLSKVSQEVSQVSQELSKVNQEVSQELSKVNQEFSQKLSNVSHEVSQKLSNVSQEVLQELPQEVLQELSKAPAPGSGPASKSGSTPAPVPPSVPNNFEKHVNLLAIAAYNTIRDKFTLRLDESLNESLNESYIENMQKHLYITGFTRTTHYKNFALNNLFTLLLSELPFTNKYKNIDIINAIKTSLMLWKPTADRENITLEQFLSGNNLEDLSMRFGELNPNDNFYPHLDVLRFLPTTLPRGSPEIYKLMIIDNPSAEKMLEEAIKGAVLP